MARIAIMPSHKLVNHNMLQLELDESMDILQMKKLTYVLSEAEPELRGTKERMIDIPNVYRFTRYITALPVNFLDKTASICIGNVWTKSIIHRPSEA